MGVVGAAEAAEGGGFVGIGLGRRHRSQSHGENKVERQEYDRVAGRVGELAIGRRVLVPQIIH